MCKNVHMCATVAWMNRMWIYYIMFICSYVIVHNIPSICLLRAERYILMFLSLYSSLAFSIFHLILSRDIFVNIVCSLMMLSGRDLGHSNIVTHVPEQQANELGFLSCHHSNIHENRKFQIKYWRLCVRRPGYYILYYYIQNDEYLNSPFDS